MNLSDLASAALAVTALVAATGTAIAVLVIALRALTADDRHYSQHTKGHHS